MAQIVTETQSFIDSLKDLMTAGIRLEICNKMKDAYTKHEHERLFETGWWKFCFL